MLRRTQAASLQNAIASTPAKVIAVCSGKGGVGKTNVASNVAVALGAIGRDVCLLDADISLANVDVLLGMQPRFNLSHVAAGEIDLEATMLRGPENIRIVPASSGNFSMTELAPASQAAIIHAFNGLERQPEILIVDTAAGISPTVARFVQAAQHAVVVVQDEPASLTDAYALIKVFSKNYGVSHFNIVTNRSPKAGAGRQLFAKLTKVADKYLDVVLRHLGDVPADGYLVKAVQQQRAVVDAYPLSASGVAFLKIAKSIDRMQQRHEPSGGIEFFLERLLQPDACSRGDVA